jgi:hypothetical protein
VFLIIALKDTTLPTELKEIVEKTTDLPQVTDKLNNVMLYQVTDKLYNVMLYQVTDKLNNVMLYQVTDKLNNVMLYQVTDKLNNVMLYQVTDNLITSQWDLIFIPTTVEQKHSKVHNFKW